MTANPPPEPGAREPAEGQHDAIEERLEERLAELRSDAPVERQMLNRAIGGWRGVADASVPTVMFLLVYAVLSRPLDTALIWAVGTAVVMAGVRAVRREPLTQIAGGFAGVLVSAFVASRSGQSQDFFLPGLLVNVAYFSGSLISVLVGWPVIGLLLGAINGSLTGWRQVPAQRRAYAAATWIWVGVFAVRLLVQLPLYAAGQTGALGVAKLVMGWPLFLLAAWLTFLVLRPVFHLSSSPSDSDAAAPRQVSGKEPPPHTDSSAESDFS